MIGEELLHPIAWCAKGLAAVEPYHIGTPLNAVLVHEDRRIATHPYDIGVVLHSHHEDSLAHRSIHVASSTVTLCDGILARIDDGTLAVIVVETMILIDEPRRIAIVMLIQDVYGVIIAPSRIVSSPRLHITYALHFGETCLDGIIEHTETLGIVVALVGVVLHVVIVVLVAYLDVRDVERLWVSILSTHLAIMTRDRTVSIFESTKTFVNPRLQFV